MTGKYIERHLVQFTSNVRLHLVDLLLSFFLSQLCTSQPTPTPLHDPHHHLVTNIMSHLAPEPEFEQALHEVSATLVRPGPSFLHLTHLTSCSHLSTLSEFILIGALPRQEPRIPKSPHRRPDPRAYHPVPSHLGGRPGSAPGQQGLPSTVQLGFGPLQGRIEVAPQCQLEHLEVVSLRAGSVSYTAELLLTSVVCFSCVFPLPPLQPRIRADLQERPYRSQHGRWKGRMRL